MAKRVFQSDLSKDGIQKLIKQLEEYRDKTLPGLLNTFVKKLSQKGVEIAKAEIVSLDAVFTGDLFNGITTRSGGSTKDTVTFFIVADSEHAAFVEFGTGLIGKEEPYIGELPPGVNWEYVVGKQLVANIAKGVYGWFYNKNGSWYFTQGMPSRPFMYMTSLELMNEVVSIAKEVFA